MGTRNSALGGLLVACLLLCGCNPAPPADSGGAAARSSATGGSDTGSTDPATGAAGEPAERAALGDADAESLEVYLKSALAQDLPQQVYDEETFRWFSTLDLAGSAATTASPSSPAGDASGTNLQVEGVDEQDRVKFGAGHLYVALPQTTYLGWNPMLVSFPRLRVPAEALPPIDVAPVARPAVLLLDPASTGRDVVPKPQAEPARIRVLRADEQNARAEPVATISLSELGTRIVGLYFVPASVGDPMDLLIAVTSGSPHGAYPARFAEPYHWENARTSVHWFDVTDPTAPVELAKLSFQGRLASSRRIEDRLYLVSRHTAYLNFDWQPVSEQARNENARLLERAALEDLVPVASWDDGSERLLAEPRDCWVADQDDAVLPSPALTTITQIDLRGVPEQRSVCMAGAVHNLFASTQSLYLITEAWTTGGLELRKFALGGEGPEYRGRGRVPGSLSGRGVGASFRLGENNGVVGVVTTLHRGHPEFAGAGDYEHRLTLLGEAEGTPRALRKISQLPNERQPEAIGKPDELLHGVRFLGDRVYLVTFRRIDPLYILDIADPKNPRIAGQVEIPGFSEYLHPVGDDLLLGIGQEVAINNRFQGVKAELFDVSDPSTLRSIDSVSVGRWGSASAALVDHHAISFLAGIHGEPDRFAFPVQNHDSLPEGVDQGSPDPYYDWTDTGLHLFDLVHDSPARLVARGVVVASQASEESVFDYRLRSTLGDRSVIQGDAVHYVHGEEVWSAFWDDPEGAVGPQ